MNTRCITDNLNNLTTKELADSLPPFWGSFGDDSSTAVLNWRFRNDTEIPTQFFNMGEGYFETATCLLNNCIEDYYNLKRDVWIFPILFNVVHGIELYLKGFNSLLRTFPESIGPYGWGEYKIHGKHDIKQLYEEAVSLIRQKIEDKNYRDEFVEELKFIQKFIDMLYTETNDMTFARYPIDNKKNGHFYTQSNQNICINLHVLKQWVARLYQICDNISLILNI